MVVAVTVGVAVEVAVEVVVPLQAVVLLQALVLLPSSGGQLGGPVAAAVDATTPGPGPGSVPE